VGRERDLTVPEKVTIEVLAPVQKAIWRTFVFFIDLGRRYIFLVETAEENVRLRDELAQLKQRMVLYQQDHLANQRLRGLLDFKERSELTMIAAEVVASDPLGWFKTVMVDKGSSDGVGRGMAVVDADGVVGRTIEVSYGHCLVLLLNDRSSGVDALVLRSRDRGILKGSPEGVCRLDFVIRNVEVFPGDTIVTSGLAGVFPKGLILGRVSQIRQNPGKGGMFQSIEVEPAVDFDRLEEVLIILKENPFIAEGQGG
jgi:rod shape-determining protein MreC